MSDDLTAKVLTVVVTVGLAGILVLLFWAGNRFQGWAANRLRKLWSRSRQGFPALYLAALAERHRRLDLLGAGGPADRPRLRQVHVTLRKAAPGGGDGPRLHWSALLAPGEKRRWVILGSPGAGKSTFLDYLVLVCAGGLESGIPPPLARVFPLFARLRELGLEGIGSLPALLAWPAPLERVPADFPSRRLRKGGCLVLLDGLDEVPGEALARVCGEIERLARENPDNHYVVTCRTSGWHGQLPGFQPYEIEWEYREILGERCPAASELGADPRAEARHRLLDRLSRDEAAGPFRGLAETLAAADLDGARRWMEEELRGRDPLRQKRVLELLPELGEAHAGPLAAVVLGLAGAGSDPGVRLAALRALPGFQGRLGAEAWPVLEKARQEREPALRNAAAWAWCALGRPGDLGLVEVPAGEFLAGSAGEEFGDLPERLLYLPSFYIRRHPVTVGEFSAFLAESGHPIRPFRTKGRFRRQNRQADHPVVRLLWSDAEEYARWHGMRLPTEAEWEKAARGADGRRFPWGDEWRTGHANTLEAWPSRRKAGTTPVGSYSPQGDSPCGCADMAGNVWEWARSEDGYGSRMLRGGAADEDFRSARCAWSRWDDPRESFRFVGFRVVLVPFLRDLEPGSPVQVARV
jgi:Sulfatase-modifying factor enzyme 1/NACHT domain